MNFSPGPFTGRHKWNPSQTAWCTCTASGISTRPSRS